MNIQEHLFCTYYTNKARICRTDKLYCSASCKQRERAYLIHAIKIVITN